MASAYPLSNLRHQNTTNHQLSEKSVGLNRGKRDPSVHQRQSALSVLE